MVEYIDREAAIASLCCDCSATGDCRPGERCVDYQRLKDIPAADAVAVVRCADCRSFQCNIRQDENGNLVVPVGVSKFECRWWCAEVSPKDYCSYAKRKESGNG